MRISTTIILGFLIGSFIVWISAENNSPTPGPIVLGNPAVVEVQDGEVWSAPVVLPPSEAIDWEGYE